MDAHVTCTFELTAQVQISTWHLGGKLYWQCHAVYSSVTSSTWHM